MATDNSNGATQMDAYQDAYNELTSEPGYDIDTDAMRAAADAGLVDGDVIGLGHAGGKSLVARIEGDTVVMVHGDAETARMPLAAMTAEQRHRMLVSKCRRAGSRGTTTGRI